LKFFSESNKKKPTFCYLFCIFFLNNRGKEIKKRAAGASNQSAAAAAATSSNSVTISASRFDTAFDEQAAVNSSNIEKTQLKTTTTEAT